MDRVFSNARQQMFTDWSVRSAIMKESFSEEEEGQSVSERFEKQVRLYSSCTAVRHKGSSITYEMLNKTANRIAGSVLSICRTENSRIALYFGHNTSAISAMIGVLKSGMTYIPVDPSYPPERISYILEDARPSLILTENSICKTDKKLRDIGYPVLDIDKIGPGMPEENIGIKVPPEAMAYILYTSGSTGIPKGVMQTHRNLLHFIRSYTNSLGITSADRLSLLPSMSFSASLMDIYGALLNGASVYPFNVKEEGLSQLADWLITEKITVYHSVPTLFRHLVDSTPEDKHFSEVRLIDLGGEPVHNADVVLFKRKFPRHCVFVNHTAFTEASVAMQYFIDHRSEISTNKVPCGYAAEGIDISLIDEEEKEADTGKTGEIIVKSRYLSPGYWQKPELTDGSFCNDKDIAGQRIYRTGDLGRRYPDGCIEHIGRNDFRVKVRGYTVQPEEIERVLLGIEGVKQAAVIGKKYTLHQNLPGKKDGHDGTVGHIPTQRLVAYIAVDRNIHPTSKDIRKYLSSILPDYMVPSVFVMLDVLPHTPTGKIDRKNLPEPDIKLPRSGTVYIPAGNKTEATITSICEELLDISPIGIKDSFSDMGIDSILYFHLILEAEKRLSRRFPTDGKFIAKTAEELASVFDGGTSAVSAGSKDSGNMKYFPLIHYSSWVLSLINKLRFKRYNPVRTAIFSAGFLIFSYRSALKLLSWYCRQGWVQKIFFRRRVDTLRQFLSEIKTVGKEDYIISTSLFCNFFRLWICGSLARSSEQEFNEWVSVTGLQTLQQSLRKDRGLILVFSHLSLTNMVYLALYRNGFDDIFSIATKSRTDIAKIIGLTQTDQIILTTDKDDRFFFRQLLVVKKKLEEGGILLIAGDGNQGESGINIAFLGRSKKFRSGFAELAISTGADAIPVFASMGPSGHINIEFLAPLDKGTPEAGHQEKVESLIRQYADILGKRWAEDPGIIRWNRITKFLLLPKTTG